MLLTHTHTYARYQNSVAGGAFGVFQRNRCFSKSTSSSRQQAMRHGRRGHGKMKRCGSKNNFRSSRVFFYFFILLVLCVFSFRAVCGLSTRPTKKKTRLTREFPASSENCQHRNNPHGRGRFFQNFRKSALTHSQIAVARLSAALFFLSLAKPEGKFAKEKPLAALDQPRALDVPFFPEKSFCSGKFSPK